MRLRMLRKIFLRSSIRQRRMKPDGFRFEKMHPLLAGKAMDPFFGTRLRRGENYQDRCVKLIFNTGCTFSDTELSYAPSP